MRTKSLRTLNRACVLAACTATLATGTAPASGQSATPGFTLGSDDIAPGKPFPAEHMLNSFGCTGGNKSPRLTWSVPPDGTKSFVLTMYDPDAPTGSGWWHWVVYDIPASATGLPAAAGQEAPFPAGTVQGKGDSGLPAYAGPCPPQGGPAHRYVFTLHALKVDKLPVPPDASPALIGLMTTLNRIGQATLTVPVSR